MTEVLVAGGPRQEAPPDRTASGLPAPRPRTPRARARRTRLAIVGTALAVAFGILLYEGLTNAIVYFRTADQAVADRAQLGTSTFRIEGTVVAGSIRRAGSTTRFTIESAHVDVPVIDQGTPPQLFAAGIPVVLVGHFLAGDGPGDTSITFWTDQVMVKHSATYIAQHPGRVRAPNGSTR